MVIKRSGPGFATLNARLAELEGVQAKAGWFETAKYPNGTPVAYIAAIQEFGYTKETEGADGKKAGVEIIPPRPFMRPTVAREKKSWLALLRQGATSCLTGNTRPVEVMEAVAMLAAGDVGVTIMELMAPPLSPQTIKRKGFAKPLIDTALMFQSVTGVVEKT